MRIMHRTAATSGTAQERSSTLSGAKCCNSISALAHDRVNPPACTVIKPVPLRNRVSPQPLSPEPAPESTSRGLGHDHGLCCVDGSCLAPGFFSSNAEKPSRVVASPYRHVSFRRATLRIVYRGSPSMNFSISLRDANSFVGGNRGTGSDERIQILF